jgi:hypothetical protein
MPGYGRVPVHHAGSGANPQVKHMCATSARAVIGLLGLRTFEATGMDISDLREEHGHRVLRVVGNGTKIACALPPAVGRAVYRAIRARAEGPILPRRARATDRRPGRPHLPSVPRKQLCPRRWRSPPLAGRPVPRPLRARRTDDHLHHPHRTHRLTPADPDHLRPRDRADERASNFGPGKPRPPGRCDVLAVCSHSDSPGYPMTTSKSSLSLAVQA